MSGVLLDTHTFLWALEDDSRLSSGARQALGAHTNLLSLASVWELAIKSGLGKVTLPVSLSEAVQRARHHGAQLLPLELPHVLRVETLPAHHRDPFDRLLAAQCLSLDVPLVSRDAVFDLYGVRRIW